MFQTQPQTSVFKASSVQTVTGCAKNKGLIGFSAAWRNFWVGKVVSCGVRKLKVKFPCELMMVGIKVTFWHLSLLITWNLVTMELSSFSAQPVQKSNHLVISDLWRIFQPPNELMWCSTPSKNIMQQKSQNGNLPGGMNTKHMWNHHLFWEMSPLFAWAWLSVKNHPEWCLTKHLLAN